MPRPEFASPYAACMDATLPGNCGNFEAVRRPAENRRKRLAAAVAGAIALVAGAAAAGAAPPELALPVDCAPGASCWISNHVDRDPGPGASDYRGGGFTYDGHKGTDFALRGLPEMERGVAVLAAAAGRVLRVRDGMADDPVAAGGAEAVEGRECGNGAVIDHGDGWRTQYCHLRAGSLAVLPGEPVAAGARLGLIGLSGLSEYPHLHFQLSAEGQIVDPFTGRGPDGRALWRADVLARLPYRPFVVYNFGFTASRPDGAAVRAGDHRARTLARDAPALILWAEAFAARPGDRLRLVIAAPDGGTVMTREFTVDRRQARIFRFAGRKRPAGGWTPGRYEGRIAVLPEGGPAIDIRHGVDVR